MYFLNFFSSIWKFFRKFLNMNVTLRILDMWRPGRKGTLGWQKSIFKFLYQSTVFQFVFYKKLSIWKSIFVNLRSLTSRTVTCVSVTRFHIRHKKFPGDWTDSCTIIASIFFNIFINVKQNCKYSSTEKSMSSFEMKK